MDQTGSNWIKSDQIGSSCCKMVQISVLNEINFDQTGSDQIKKEQTSWNQMELNQIGLNEINFDEIGS